MRKIDLLAALAALSLAGGAAVAKTEKMGDAPKEKKICKGEVGAASRIAKKRVCRTKAEWESMANQEDLDDSAGKLRGMSRGN